MAWTAAVADYSGYLRPSIHARHSLRFFMFLIKVLALLSFLCFTVLDFCSPMYYLCRGIANESFESFQQFAIRACNHSKNCVTLQPLIEVSSNSR